jgi:hypothetical protein
MTQKNSNPNHFREYENRLKSNYKLIVHPDPNNQPSTGMEVKSFYSFNTKTKENSLKSLQNLAYSWYPYATHMVIVDNQLSMKGTSVNGITAEEKGTYWEIIETPKFNLKKKYLLDQQGAFIYPPQQKR